MDRIVGSDKDSAFPSDRFLKAVLNKLIADIKERYLRFDTNQSFIYHCTEAKKLSGSQFVLGDELQRKKRRMRGTRAGKAKKARLLAGNMIIQVDGTPTTTVIPASIQPVRLGDKLLNQIINNSTKDVSNNRNGFSTQDDSLNELSTLNASSNSHQHMHSSSSNRMYESQNSFVSQGSAQHFTGNSVNTNNQSVSTNGTSRKEKMKRRRRLLRKKQKSIYLNSKDNSFQEDIPDHGKAAELPMVIDPDCGKMHHINRKFHTLVSHQQT